MFESFHALWAMYITNESKMNRWKGLRCKAKRVFQCFLRVTGRTKEVFPLARKTLKINFFWVYKWVKEIQLNSAESTIQYKIWQKVDFGDISRQKNFRFYLEKSVVENHEVGSDSTYSSFQQKFGHPRDRILFHTIIEMNWTDFVRFKDWHQFCRFSSHFSTQPKMTARCRNFWQENSPFWKVQTLIFHWKKESSVLDTNWRF